MEMSASESASEKSPNWGPVSISKSHKPYLAGTDDGAEIGDPSVVGPDDKAYLYVNVVPLSQREKSNMSQLAVDIIRLLSLAWLKG